MHMYLINDIKALHFGVQSFLINDLQKNMNRFVKNVDILQKM